MLAILGGAGLGEDLEIDEAEGHEAEGEPRHEAGKENQQGDDENVDEEVGIAAVVLHRHSPPLREKKRCLCLLLPTSNKQTTSSTESFLLREDKSPA